MPSPFSGMDPYLEDRYWTEFHREMIRTLMAIVAPSLANRYEQRSGELREPFRDDFGSQARLTNNAMAIHSWSGS
jgi:hypothetical protein